MRKAVGMAAATLVALMLILSLVSCGARTAESIAERAVERAAAREGVDADVDVGSGSVTMSDAQGNTVIVGETSLPSDWPSAVPFMDGIEVTFAGTSRNADKSSWSLTGTYDGSPDEVFDYFKNRLSGWHNDGEVATEADGSAFYSYQASNDSYEIALMVTDDGGQTAITLALNER